jgi:hypothetical protein
MMLNIAKGWSSTENSDFVLIKDLHAKYGVVIVGGIHV